MQRILLALVLGCTVGAAPGEARSEDNTYSAYSAYYADEQTAETGSQSAEQSGPRDGCCKSFCDECECCDWAWDAPRLLGLFLASDHCFDDFISPLSNPFFFEDPRSLTEVRTIFIENGFPANISGGDAQMYSAQFRGRLTERLSVIAPNVGYFQVNQASNNAAPVGFASAPIGVKYNFIRDVESQFLVSGGITYFIPPNFANFNQPADGDLHVFLTGGKRIFDRGHWLSGTGFRIPLNNNWGTQFWYWSNQWDYEIVDNWFPLLGLNWWHYMSSSGVAGASPVTGLDLINIPNANVAGTNVVSGVVGFRWKATDRLTIGSGYEFPLTSRKDILQNRLYVDAIFRY